MPNGDLEGRVAGAEQEEKPEPSWLESPGEEFGDAGRVALNSSVIASMVALPYFLLGWAPSLTAAAIPLNTILTKDELKLEDVAKSSVVGGATATSAYIGVNIINQIPSAFGIEGLLGAAAVAGLGFTVFNPVLNALFYGLEAATTGKNIYGHVKENFVKSLKDTWLLNALTASAMGVAYLFPAYSSLLYVYFAASAIVYPFFLRPDAKFKIERVLYPIKYCVNKFAELGSGTISLASKSYHGFAKGAYDFGAGLYNLFTKTAEAVAPAAPAQEAALPQAA
jgi:hypothetical protein